MADGIHEFGKDAHDQVVSAGRYAVGPNGQLVLLQPHVPLKPGFRLAEAQDLIAAAKAAGEREALEQLEAERTIDEARAAADALVESERPEREANAARAAAKAAERAKTEKVIAPAIVDHEQLYVGPDGRIVELPRGVTIKPGWRPATPEDVAALNPPPLVRDTELPPDHELEAELAQPPAEGEHHDDGDRGEQPQDAAAQPAATGESVDGS